MMTVLCLGTIQSSVILLDYEYLGHRFKCPGIYKVVIRVQSSTAEYQALGSEEYESEYFKNKFLRNQIPELLFLISR